MTYFSRIDITDPRRLGYRLANPYLFHQLVWRVLGDPDQDERDFLFRVEEGRPISILAVSAQMPSDEKGLRVRFKEYQPQLRSGQRLAFRLRANPVVRRRDEDGRQKRHDVVMDLKTRLKEEEAELPPQSVIVQEAASEWLADRAQRYGFEVDPKQVVASAYQKHKLFRGKGKRPITLCTVDFDGVLQVEDPDRFQQTLTRGIGPSKAFGCGLLTVKPV